MLRVVAFVAILTAILLAVPAIRHWRERPPAPVPPAQPLRSTWIAPGDQVPGAGAEYSFGLALAPNGRELVYPAAKAGVVTLWLQDLRNGDARTLPGTDGAAMPFWSPDGTKIGFFAGGKIRAFDPASGTVAELAEASSGRGAAWNRAGDLVFAPSAAGPLMKRDASGSTGPLTTIDAASGETAHAWPSFLPDGRHLIFLVTASQPPRAGIWLAALDGSTPPKRLLAADSQAIIVDRLMVYMGDLTLLAQPIDPDTFEPAGRPTIVGVPAGRGPIGQLFATASRDVLIYGGPGSSLRELRWLKRDGTPDGSPGEPIDAWDLRIAPDGRRIVVTELDRQLRTLDVFIRTGSQPAPTRLSLSTDVDESGTWSPDGLRIAWAGQRRKVMLRGAGAVLPDQTIAEFETPVQVWDWSRDGRALLIGRKNGSTGDDLWIQPPVEGAAAQPYVTAPFDQAYGAFAPDGRSIAYASNESGQFDIYVDTYPQPGTRLRVTTSGGTEPRWSTDGRELFFRRGSALHAVRFRDREIESITPLFDLGNPIRSYDVSRDGRFLVNLPAASQPAAPPTMISNWQPQ